MDTYLIGFTFLVVVDDEAQFSRSILLAELYAAVNFDFVALCVNRSQVLD